MTGRRFRAPGEKPPAKPPRFTHKWPANQPPRRLGPSALVRRAIEAATAREEGES
jgi:hypothetical protein